MWKQNYNISSAKLSSLQSFFSSCFEADGGGMDPLNVTWTARIEQNEVGPYRAFLGVQGSPILGTIEYEWASCETGC